MGDLLQSFVARQAERRPEAVALVDGAERVTYGALDAAANRLARLLRDAGCRPGDRVGLLLPKSAAAVTAMLAALKAGAAYVPVDPEGPAARSAMVLTAADCAVVLATGRSGTRLAETLPLLAPVRPVLGWLGQEEPPPGTIPSFGARDLEAMSAEPLPPRADPSHPAHILFTSGSTGTPKGVMVTHANVMAFVAWANAHFGLGAEDRVSCHAPLHFDLSTYDLYGAFAAGAEIHLVPPELNLFPRRLVDFIRERRLTQWFSVPSILTYLARFDAVPANGLPSLRRVIWCGETFPTPALLHWMERLPTARFTNLYGPTETTIASAWHTLEAPPADAAVDVPIGRACGGEELLVLDEALRPVPPGAAGEIVIGGAGVTLGYWRDAERTRRAFVPDPRDPQRRLYRTGDLGRVDEDGLVRFLGRGDSQIKVRGHRVELGEVEAALNEVEEIAQAVAVAVQGQGWDGVEIGCAYGLRPAADLAPARLRQILAGRLPRYMLPTRWLRCERLPANANGKIDRVALTRMLERAAQDSPA